MRILWDNFAAISGITASSEDVNFPKENIKDFHLSKVFKFSGNTAEELIVDIGESERTRAVVIDTNLSNTATVQIEANVGNDFSIPIVSSLATYYDGKFVLFFDNDLRFFKLTFTDSSVTQIEIKYLFIGDYTQMPPMDPDIDFNYGTTSRALFSRSGQSYGFKGYDIFTSDFTFPNITEYPREIDGSIIATRAEILAMWRAVENITPFYLIIYENSMDKIPPILGVFEQDTFSISRTDVDGIFETSFDFLETK